MIQYNGNNCYTLYLGAREIELTEEEISDFLLQLKEYNGIDLKQEITEEYYDKATEQAYKEGYTDGMMEVNSKVSELTDLAFQKGFDVAIDELGLVQAV